MRLLIGMLRRGHLGSDRSQDVHHVFPSPTPLLFFLISLRPRVEWYTKSTSLKYEPASEPLHIAGRGQLRRTSEKSGMRTPWDRYPEIGDAADKIGDAILSKFHSFLAKS